MHLDAGSTAVSRQGLRLLLERDIPAVGRSEDVTRVPGLPGERGVLGRRLPGFLARTQGCRLQRSQRPLLLLRGPLDSFLAGTASTLRGALVGRVARLPAPLWPCVYKDTEEILKTLNMTPSGSTSHVCSCVPSTPATHPLLLYHSYTVFAYP